jgi:pyruvate kinase
MNQLRNTKIIATIGPATNTREKILELAEAGVDIFRFNFSHSDLDLYSKLIKDINEINEEYDHTLGILADLQGPKIRIGNIENEKFRLKDGDIVIISSDNKLSDKTNIHISYPGLEEDVKKGDKVFIDDGKIVLRIITDKDDGEITAKVISGGLVTPRKGVNFPDTKMNLPSLTEKDLKDLEFILHQPVNWIALSFVRNDKNVRDLHKIIRKHKHTAKIIAKIEKPEAVKNIKKILKHSDAIMIARGDLGVEIPIEELPGTQKYLIETSIKKSKVVIVATQMMESMINNSTPTRAEVIDVANAVLQGADAVMLSGETAMGHHPLEVVNIMDKILKGAEKSFTPPKNRPKPEPKCSTFTSDIICFNAAKISNEVNAKAIVGLTVSGYTAFKVSSFRPTAPIYIFSKVRSILSTLNLVRGVRGFYYNKNTNTEETHINLANILKEKNLIKEGDIIVHTGSMPVFKKQRTNLIRIANIE